MDHRRGHLGPDVVPGGEVVGVAEDVRDVLRLSRRGGPADDPDADVDLVERVGIAGHADHRQAFGADRQVDRGERDLELAGDVVDDVLDDRRHGLRAIEPGRDPVERLERIETFAPRGGELRCALLRFRRHAQDAGHPGRCDEDDDRPDHELITELALEADALRDLPMGDHHRPGGADHEHRGDRIARCQRREGHRQEDQRCG